MKAWSKCADAMRSVLFVIALCVLCPGVAWGASAQWTIAVTHSGNFTQGQQGAAYTINPVNIGGPTSDTVVVTDTLSAGLTATSISGPGWNCTLATLLCARGSLTPNTSVPITLTVNVSATAPSSVVDTATVQNGGAPQPASASDMTTIVPATGPEILATPQMIEFNAGAGQPGPRPINIKVASVPGTGVPYEAGTVGGFLQASPGTFVTPDQAAVSITNNALGAGTYRGTVQFSENGGSQGYASSTTQVVLNVVNPSGALLNCPGTFTTAPSPYSTGANPLAVVGGDFTGDGIPDLVVLNGDGTLTVLIGNQGCGFTPAPSIFAGQGAAAMAAADFNGDGKLDLMIVNKQGASFVVNEWIGDGKGGFTATGPFQYMDNLMRSSGPVTIATGDFNRDGHIDFVVFVPDPLNGQGDAGLVFLGDGKGGFTLAPAPTQGLFHAGAAFPDSVAVGDLNGDGIPDLAVGAQDPGGVRYVRIFLGNGDGTFTQATGDPAYLRNPAGLPSAGENSVVLADFNGDGKLDLAFSVIGTNQVFVLLGDGTGHFSNQPTDIYATGIATGMKPAAIAAGDFNGDGNKDLVVADSGGNDLTVLLGDGNGGFTAAPGGTFPVGTGPVWLAVNDYNNDGRTDVAVVNGGNNTLTVLVGGLAPVTVGLTAAPNPVTAGQPVTLTAQVSATQNLALPAASVNFYKGAGAPGDLLGSASLINGVASIGYTFPGAGTYSVFAAYLGDTRSIQASSPATNISVVGTPQLQVMKSHQGSFSQGQQNATYTITVMDAAGSVPLPAPGAFVQENLPASLTLVSMSGPGWVCQGTTCQRQASDGLNGGGMYPPITVTVNVAANAPASVTNSVTVSGGNTSVTANDPTQINANPPVLSLMKSHQGNFGQGQIGATYSIVVSNAATANPTNGVVTVTENPPAALTLTGMSGNGWSCTLPTCSRSDALNGGASYPPITVSVNVVPGAPAQVTNSATVSGGGSATAGANDVTNISNPPALAVNKTHVGNFTQGQVGATYTLQVNNGANGSPGPTSGTVTVTDNAPAGLTITSMSGSGWSCTIPSCSRSDVLTGGALYPPITVTVNVAPNAPAQVTNTATVSGGGSPTLTNSDTTTITPNPAVLAVAKSHQGNFGQGQAGAAYSVVVSNGSSAGPTNGLVTVTENPPAGLTITGMSGSGWVCTAPSCTRSDVLNGSASYPPITVTVNVAGNAGAQVTNMVTVSGGGSASATASDVTNITPNPPVLAIAKSHQGNFGQGQAGAAYSVVVSNGSSAGPTTGAVTVTENPPAGLSITGMSGSGWVCTAPSCTRSDVLNGSASYPPITVTVNVAANAGAQVTNMVTVSGGGSASATASDVTNITANPPVLAIAKSHQGNFGQGQAGAAYSVVVSNGSSAGPTNGLVTVTENPPAGLTITGMSGSGWVCTAPTCTRSDVLNGAASYPPITVTVNVAANVGAQVTNMVTVSGGGSASATASDVTNITPNPPVLTIAKSHQGNFGQGQAGAAYSVVVSNGSSAGPTNGLVTVTENPPAGLTITGMSGSGWVCTAPSCTRSDVLNGSASYPPITVTVNVAGNAGAQVTNRVTVSGGGSVSASASDVTNITANPPVLTLSKSHSGFFTQGQSGAYSLVVSNAASAGPTTGTVSVQENMPTGLTLTGMSGNGWSCNLPVCTRFDVLNGGASYPPILVTVAVAGNAPTLVTNSATAFGGGSANSTASDPTTILMGQLGSPVLTIQKSHTGSFAQGQSGATYTVVVSNTGNAPTNGTVSVTDTLPAGLTLASMTGSGWSCNGATCTRADALSPNAAYPAITVTVNVDPSAPAKVTNQAAVSGGGAASANANDDTAITATSNLPFGVIDSPGPQSTGTVSGALAVTGWTLSHAGIATIGIWREPVAGETPSSNGLVFIGNAALVPGARPDIAASYPGYPGNDTGWGVLVLTNMLPGTGGLATGNGAYVLHVIATAKDSTMADLGTRSITVDNAHATQPFGTIDTPQNGEVVSGTGYVNFGWALTPNPANIIPKDGSTILVFIDNKAVGHPAYNNYRPDIAALFPGLQNSNGAVGYYTIDTTKLTNGLHTIAWVATDNAGNAQGLGSRFFGVQN